MSMLDDGFRQFRRKKNLRGQSIYQRSNFMTPHPSLEGTKWNGCSMKNFAGVKQISSPGIGLSTYVNWNNYFYLLSWNITLHYSGDKDIKYATTAQ